MINEGYPPEWIEAICCFLASAIDRVADRGSTICTLVPTRETIGHTFARFALPITWDFAESAPTNESTGGYPGAVDWITRYISHASKALVSAPTPQAELRSATKEYNTLFDIVVTDPPYYDAIPYADTMDFFYVWLRRTLAGLSSQFDAAFRELLSPKWNHETNDGELIDDSSRFGGDQIKSKAAYEDGMYRAFLACHKGLKPDGKLVIVFAHKHPDAWEALVGAIIRAGFVVDASWPIQTEMGNRTRALASAALASSVWLVCKKRLETARPGWDNIVLDGMRDKIHARLREFWDAGIRGPDFVWAATGPALEAYSRHPVVKKADHPGEVMMISEFLGHVRRLVVDFVVGRVLSHNGDEESTRGLDDVTTYYLLHRHDFGMGDAPIGACILYAISCGLSDTALVDQYDVLVRTGGKTEAGEEEEDEENQSGETEDPLQGSGSRARLKPWNQRMRKGMGYQAASGRPIPLIDQVHRLTHLWRAGDVSKVDEYLTVQGIRRNALFHQLLQALIELAPQGGEERSLLESISNHIVSRGPLPKDEQLSLPTS
jgi:hypothetical protein